MKRFAFVLLGLVASCSAEPAFAQCVSLDDERAVIAKHDGKITELGGDDLEAAGKWFNAIPPESQAMVSTAWLVDLAQDNGVVAVGPVGAICARVRVPSELWPKVREQLLGGKPV